jgi:chromosome partitioning protein
MGTIAVLSQKGGTGKTTAVRTLTDILRRIGLSVLAVDLDPQANLSDYLDVDPDAEPTIGDVLAGRAKPAEAVHDGIIPANLGLAEAELMLGGKMGRELTLKRALSELKPAYDVVLIDCPPALGLLTVNALVAAEYALLSAEAQYFALQGVEQALEVIELARDSLNPDLQWLGVVLNIADMRTRHSREAFDSLREHFGDKLLDTTIRASIAYAESAERAVSILDYRPDLATDYLNVADELLRRLGMDGPRERVEALLNGSRPSDLWGGPPAAAPVGPGGPVRPAPAVRMGPSGPMDAERSEAHPPRARARTRPRAQTARG